MKKTLILTIITLILCEMTAFAQIYSLYGYQNGRYGVFLGTFQVAGNTIYKDEYGQDSIFNKYGNYGNKYSLTSIWNQYCEWGSKFFLTSATNPYATNPPAIVDNWNNIVGYLTANQYFSNTNFGKSVSRYFRLQR